MGTAGVQTQEFSTGMVGTPPNGQSRCTDPGTQHRGWWEFLIMGAAGVQTWNLSTGIWGTLIMGTAGVQTQEFSTWMVGTPPNGQSRCADPGLSAQGWWEPLV
ncbi:unnamed protein product, partial [Staurois parvus]